MLEFKVSESLTIGVELELQLINCDTFNLVNCIQSILAHKDLHRLPCIVKPEVTKNNLEINSSVHHTISTLYKELVEMRNELNTLLAQTGYTVCGGGTHPFQDWKSSEIYPSKHNLEVEKKYGYLAKQDTIFGMHIHIGCTSGDEAIYLCNILSMYVPHLIALSASSPYFREVDTHYHSSRINISSSFPTSGVMPALDNWNDFSNYFSLLQQHKVIEIINDIYWDIRPQSNLGTVEIRVFDMPLTIDKACNIAAFVQGLCKHLLIQKSSFLSKDLYTFYNYNKYQSAKNGFNATYIHPISHIHYNLKDHMLTTLIDLKPYLEEYYFSSLRSQISMLSNDSVYLRKKYSEENCYRQLVNHQVELWNS